MLKIILTIGALQGLGIVITFFRSKVVAVWLGPAGVGIISTIDQVVQSASYFSALSLPYASIKFLSKSHSEGDEAFRRSYSSFLKALLILSVMGTLLTAGVVIVGVDLLGSDIAKYKGLLLVALLGIPAAVLGGFFINVFAAAKQFKSSSVFGIVNNAFTFAGVCAGILLGGIAGLYVGGIVAGAVVTGGTLIYLRNKLDLPFHSPGGSFLEELRRHPDIVPFSLIMYVAAFAYSLSLLVGRYSVLKHFGEAQAGLLQGAIAIAIAMGMVLSPANGLYLTPIMNRNIDKLEKFHTATEFQRKLLVIVCAFALPAVMFPKLVLTLMFSSKFVMASTFVYLFVVWQFLSQMAGVNQAVMIGLDDLAIYAVITVSGFLSLAVLALILTPKWGILGVAIAFITSAIVILLSTSIRLRFKHGLQVSWSFVTLVGYGLTALLAAGVAGNRYESWDAGTVLLKTALYALFGGGLFLFLSKDEKGSLIGVWGRVVAAVRAR